MVAYADVAQLGIDDMQGKWPAEKKAGKSKGKRTAQVLPVEAKKPRPRS